MYYLGIDVSKASSRYIVLRDEGTTLKSFSLRNNHESFHELTNRLTALGCQQSNLLIGMEATGAFWENLYGFLTNKRFRVILLNPYHTSKFREALAKKAKTDDIDALIVAQLLRTGEYVQSQVADEDIQTLRELVSTRYEFVTQRKNYQRKVYSLLAVIFPEFATTAIKNPFSVASSAILKRFPTALHLAQAKPRHIEKLVRSIQGNNFNINEIEHLITTAQKSIYQGRAREARATTMRMLLEHIEQLTRSIEELESNIHQILSPSSTTTGSESFPGSNLLTIPGVGEKTVAAVLSYLGKNGQSFETSTKAVGYIGFFPRICESGQTRRDNKISKRGPKLLRAALYMAAVASLKHNTELRTLYHRKLSQGKTEKQALICVAKKLLQIMLAMLKSGQPYNPALVFVPA
jgi:transposase